MRDVSARTLETPEALADYYRAPAVRDRIDQYCGASGDGMSAWAIAGFGGRNQLAEADGAPVSCAPFDRPRLRADGADICRSLADTGGTLLQLDVDYVHPADWAEPYREPARCFRALEPVYEALCAAFESHCVRPLVLMTGRGYHFVVRATRDSPLAAGLAAIGTITPGTRSRCDAMEPFTPGAAAMSEAHDGAGRLLEHLCRQVLRAVEGRSRIPLALADLPPPDGGPFVCLDLSAFGDPLFSRYARCAFSGNQKAWMRGADGLPFVLVLPRAGDPLEVLLRVRREPALAVQWAARSDARIPDMTEARAWLDGYRNSALAAFHHEFDGGPHAHPSTWRYTYDAIDPASLPPCVAVHLQEPYPALLEPVRLRTLALVLRDQGWHPRSIAALVASRYDRHRVWGGLWWRYDRETRAAFYVRLLLAAADGRGEAAELSCATQRMRGACPRADGCGFDLANLRPRRPFS